MAKESTATKEQLAAAAEDMNELMGLEPAIDVEGDEEELIAGINKNVQYIEPQDIKNTEDPEEQFQPQTVKTLRALEIRLPGDPEPQKDTSYHPKAKAGVLEYILQIIKERGPVSKKRILKELAKRFPEREVSGMKNTINVQVPGKIRKKHGDILVKDAKNRWSIKRKKKKK